jgi:Domain of unknown function (DUF4394)
MRSFTTKQYATWLWLVPALVGLGCGDDNTNDGTPGDQAENMSVSANTYALTSESRLVYFDRTSGDVRSAKSVTGLAAGESILGIDFRPSDAALYALTSTGRVYTINVATAYATLKSTLSADTTDTTSPFAALQGDKFGVNFNPVADRLRVVSSAGQNLRINVDTGATTTDGALNPGTPAASAAAYSNAFAAACRTRLYVIDTTTSKLLLQDPPNTGTLTEIGDLGAASADAEWAGFEVVTKDDGTSQALALFSSADGAAIYDLDLATAALTNMRDLELHDGETLRGSSAAPPATSPVQPPGEILGVTVNNKLVSFNRGAPGKLCTNQAITGVGSGEDVLGIDIRPADGKLYALGSAGKVYTLDVPTGAAELHSTLSAAPDDLTEPFTALSAGEIGVGFNPVPDRLRAIGREGQSLRINVDTGATTTDSSMSPATLAVAGVAYTNAYAGATSTTLFAIDAVLGDLARVGATPATTGACPLDLGNPNCGVVSTVGTLGVTGITSVDGFDIDGDPAAANAAILALTVGTATSSSLYVVDLATGVATPPTGVANPTIGGGVALREITLAANPSVTP